MNADIMFDELKTATFNQNYERKKKNAHTHTQNLKRAIA